MNHIKNIAIIGAGQLGSRHLQGLKLAQIPMTISVVDSSLESLEVARVRYEQVEENPLISSIEFTQSIDSLPAVLDLVIIATGSMPRAAIVTDLLNKKSVKNLVLEKVLFPTLSQYDQVEALLRTKGLLEHTWVNCSRRMFDYYEQIKQAFCNDKHITMEVQGAEWGLGCNSIHFIDIFSYLTGQTDWIFEFTHSDKIKNQIIESRRGGYVDLLGEISGRSANGSMIKLLSIEKSYGELPFTTQLSSDSQKIIINEVNQKIYYSNGQEEPIVVKFQSQLTGVLAEDILMNGCCRLTSYLESAKLHKAFLRSVVELYNTTEGKQGDSCPIT